MQELKEFRNYNYKRYLREDGQFESVCHAGHIHYWDKLNQDGSGARFREIDTTLIKQVSGWKQTYSSYHSTIPEYADEFASFRDLYKDKDREILLRGVCSHVKGELGTDNKSVVYPNAFGSGIDLIYSLGNNNFQKLVRINNKPSVITGMSFEFEVKLPKEELKVGEVVKQSLSGLKLKGEEQLTVGAYKSNTENYTYFKPRHVWDSALRTEAIDAEFSAKQGKTYLKKIITKEFLEKAVYPVYTDTVTSVYGDTNCAVIYIQNSNWTTCRTAATGTAANLNATYIFCPQCVPDGGGSYYLHRSAYNFDTSSIADGDTINSASFFQFYNGQQEGNGFEDDPYFVIYQGTHADTPTTADFDSFNSTEVCDRVQLSDYNGASEAYIEFPITSGNLSIINKTGITKLFKRLAPHDADGTAGAPTDANGARLAAYFPDNTGTSKDPYLSVVHEAAPADVFPTGWGKRHKITIDADMVSGTSNLTDFPVLLTESNFLQDAFDNSDNGGGDIRFSTDTAGSTQLACEVVNWDNGATNKAEVWVKIPTLSYDSDTVIYVWYSNTGETQPAANNTYGANSVWSNGYDAVYHMQNNFNDSTSNNYAASTVSNLTFASTAVVGGGYSLNNSSSYAALPDFFDNKSAGCISIWFNSDGYPTGADWDMLLMKNDNVQLGITGLDLAGGEDTIALRIRQSSGTWYNAEDADFYGNFAAGNWYRLAGTFGAGGMKLRCNKTEIATNAQTGGNTYTTTSTTWDVGRYTSGSNYFGGDIDELRFETIQRTSDWLDTEYDNQNSPSTFSTGSDAVTIGSTALKDPIYSGIVAFAR